MLYLFVAAFAALIFTRLYSLQIKSGAQYREIADSRLSLSVPVAAPRGEITDRYGRPLVTNRTGYFVMLEKTGETKKTQTTAILNALAVLMETENSKKYTDSLPISLDAPFSFSGAEEETQKFLKGNGLDEGTTAEKVVEFFCETYQIDEGFSQKEKRLLCGVYLGMEQEGFSATTPYTLAEDVDIETVTKLKERAELFPGVRIYERPVREYLYPETAVHILGRVGKLSSEEYEKYKDQGYKRTDSIGKQGVEKAFESILKGTDGIRSLEENFSGEALGIVKSQDPVPGNTVILTLDLTLQQAAERALAQAVTGLKDSQEKGGAVVAIDVNTGEVLASASYPTYDITTFNKDYTSLVENQAKPMFNRALSGLYEPGSTFKPISAIAAIDNGTVSPEEKIDTKGKYEYLDRTFQCNIFRTTGETHGKINAQEALGVSCNYYFYEIGRRTGIDAICETAARFGLGDVTGLELTGEEAKGNIASPESRAQNGGAWYPGDVLQASIGQSDNLFTPISLANYAATLANGGTNYKTRLLKAVKSTTDGRLIQTTQPEVKQMAGASQKALDCVKEGMQRVVSAGGTAQTVFQNFAVPVAGKTGSAQVAGGTNGLFIGYAPLDNPQIAISVVVENGGAGTLAASVAKEVFSAYFEKPETAQAQEEKPYSLLP